jgi:hypothetical protein
MYPERLKILSIDYSLHTQIYKQIYYVFEQSKSLLKKFE